MEKVPGEPLATADLLDRFRQGDAAAFAILVKEHRETVYAVARRLLGNHADADEAAQDAFVRAWRARSGFRGDSPMRTWLISIVLNVGRSILAARRSHAPLDALAERPDAESPSARAVLEREENAARVRGAVALLPPRQREVVVLKVFSEMTYEDVAGAMSLSVGAVKAHLHQAVANLRRRMTEEGGRA